MAAAEAAAPASAPVALPAMEPFPVKMEQEREQQQPVAAAVQAKRPRGRPPGRKSNPHPASEALSPAAAHGPEQGARRARSTPPTSRYRGVSFHQQSGKWQAGLHTPGRSVHLGYYRADDEAARAADKAAVALWGFAATPLLNFGIKGHLKPVTGKLLQDKEMQQKLVKAGL